MSALLSASKIVGTSAPTDREFLASMAYPLHGLLLIVVALLVVALAMVLLRKLVRRFQVPEEHPGPVLVPLTAGGAPPEIVAVITAAVNEVLEAGGQIVAITPLDAAPAGSQFAWSREGRREHFASHKVR